MPLGRARFTSFTPDLRGIGEMMTAQPMRMAMGGYIRIVEAAAVAGSPVSNKPAEDGKKKYVESFETTTGIQNSAPRRGHLNRRAVGTLTNTSDHANLVEYGANGIRKSRVMRNALDTLGFPTGPNSIVVEKWSF